MFVSSNPGSLSSILVGSEHFSRGYVLPLVADRCLVDWPLDAISFEQVSQAYRCEAADLYRPLISDLNTHEITRLNAYCLLNVRRKRDFTIFTYLPDGHDALPRVPECYRILAYPSATRGGVPMPAIQVETVIRAPIERCFDLARDPDLHAWSVAQTGERVVNRTGTGLLGLGDVITFEARHFGVRQRLTAKITRFEPPYLFEDRMVRGAFQWFTHVHAFEQIAGGTRMVDVFAYRAPLGPLGWLAERLFLTRYLRLLLTARAAYLKVHAEHERAHRSRSDVA